MSLYSITPADFAYDDRVRDKHRQVMLAFGVHSSRKFWIKLSQAKMASELGIARETVNRAVKDLVDWGYLEKRTPEQTGKSICFYRIVMSRAEPGDEEETLPVEGDDSVDNTSDAEITGDAAITGGCDASDHRGVTPPVTGGVTPAITPYGSSYRSKKTFSAGERASDKGAGAPAAKKAEPSFTISSTDASWSAWMDHLRDAGKLDLADEATQTGKIVVSARWPHTGSARFIRVEGVPQTATVQARGKMASVGSE